jgi:hypothetical protein
MEKIYRTPDMEVTEFEMVDVISASNPYECSDWPMIPLN